MVAQHAAGARRHRGGRGPAGRARGPTLALTVARYDLLTGHLRLCVLGDAAGEASCTSHGMGAVLLRLASPSGCEELTPLLRCFELHPHLSTEMPRFKV